MIGLTFLIIKFVIPHRAVCYSALRVIKQDKIRYFQSLRHTATRLKDTTSADANISTEKNLNDNSTGDLLIAGLNQAMDVSVRVISCKEVVQESMIRSNLSPIAGQALGELMVCSMLMGSGLKEGETLQVNMVGKFGLNNVMAITDGNLKVRGLVGNPQFNFPMNDRSYLSTKDILGDGEIQVVRNHPLWKHPTNGVVSLRETKIPLNMAFYMAESEQRTSVLIVDVSNCSSNTYTTFTSIFYRAFRKVKVEGTLCRHALGLMVERLPGATEENIEISIKNLERIERNGLRSYLNKVNEPEDPVVQNSDSVKTEVSFEGNLFRSFEASLDSILQDSFESLGTSIRFLKYPKYTCGCNEEKVWRALRLLPVTDIEDIVKTGDDVQVRVFSSV